MLKILKTGDSQLMAVISNCAEMEELLTSRGIKYKVTEIIGSHFMVIDGESFRHTFAFSQGNYSKDTDSIIYKITPCDGQTKYSNAVSFGCMVKVNILYNESEDKKSTEYLTFSMLYDIDDVRSMSSDDFRIEQN